MERSVTTNVRRVVSVELLRVAAATCVVIAHLLGDFASHGALLLFSHYEIGASGVDLFFIISGFVITYSSRYLWVPSTGWKRFLVLRITKILPMYWFATLLFVICQMTRGKSIDLGLYRVIASLCFFPFCGGDASCNPVYSVGWTLNYEAFYYLVVLCAFLLFPRQLDLAVLGALLMLVVVGCLTKTFYPLAFWSKPIVLEFAFGMIAARAFENGRRLNLPLGIILLLLSICIYCVVSSERYRLAGGIPDGFDRVISWGVPSAIMFVSCVFSLEKYLFSFDRIKILSESTYSIYLLHPLFIILFRPLNSVMVKTSGDSYVLQFMVIVINLICIIGVSVMVHLLVERRMIQGIRFFAFNRLHVV